jgi:DHA2 family multidrug resistance protein-like MFS transporter
VFGTAVYRGRIAGTLPAGVPPHAAQTAHDTLGGAVAAAGRLPDRTGAALAEAARQAFGYGLHVAFAICAVLTLAAAVVAAVLLRHRPALLISPYQGIPRRADGLTLSAAIPTATLAGEQPARSLV